MNKKYFSIIQIILMGLFSSSCATIPKGAVAIKSFDVSNYLGKWYEIARMDFRFEKDLDHTTAEYALNPNGTVQVLNKGFNYKKKQWKQAKGLAKFVSSSNEGRLKVSFFRPFYGAYNIIALDKDYRYALVVGKNLKYLWILSREKSIPDAIKEDYLAKAKALGFEIDKLVWVSHQ